MTIRIIPFVTEIQFIKPNIFEIIPDIYLNTEELTLYIDFLFFQLTITWFGFIEK